MENAGNPFEEVFKSIVDHGHARMIYGEPVTLEGKTILPVAQIRYGFGGGSGRRKNAAEQGHGGGGGLIAKPVGVVEITAGQTRFLPITPNWKLAAAFGIGVCLGLAVARVR